MKEIYIKLPSTLLIAAADALHNRSLELEKDRTFQRSAERRHELAAFSRLQAERSRAVRDAVEASLKDDPVARLIEEVTKLEDFYRRHVDRVEDHNGHDLHGDLDLQWEAVNRALAAAKGHQP